MALGATVQPASESMGNPTVPVSVTSDWFEAHGDLKTADNGGSRVDDPGALNSAAHHEIRTRGYTSIMLRAEYTNTATTTDPQIQVFGKAKDKDGNDTYTLLKDADDTEEITLDCDNANDVLHDGTRRASTWVELDVRGHEIVIVAVKVAGVGPATITCQGKVL